MQAYPLKSLSLEEAKQKQFELVDVISRHFEGDAFFQMGDVGLVPGLNQSKATLKVEQVLADFFHQEAAILVRGAGTAAIRESLAASLKAGDTILLHTSEIYPTTKTSIDQLNLEVMQADFNEDSSVIEAFKQFPQIKGVLIQVSRQSLEDHYDLKHVIDIIRLNSDAIIITDDNYTVMKTDRIGAEHGADLSAFSMFKLLGPEGIGCIVGSKKKIDIIRSFHYSGGTQVQGPEALEVLRSLVYAPVSLAIQAEEGEELVSALKSGVHEAIEDAIIVNAQSKVILVKFKEGIAQEILKAAPQYGAASYPVGSESRYEILPLFYRLSGTLRKQKEEYTTHWIRINPMRSGAETVLRILDACLEKVKSCS